MALWFFWLMQAFLLAHSSTPTTNPAAPARTSPIALEVVPETVTAQSLCADVAKFVNTNHSGRPRAGTPTAAKKSAKRTIVPHVARLFNHLVKYANETLLQGQHEVTMEDVLGHKSAPLAAQQLVQGQGDARLKCGIADSVINFITDPRSGHHSHTHLHGMIGQTLTSGQLHQFLGGDDYMSLSHAEQAKAQFKRDFPVDGPWAQSFFTLNKKPGTTRDTTGVVETVRKPSPLLALFIFSTPHTNSDGNRDMGYRLGWRFSVR